MPLCHSTDPELHRVHTHNTWHGASPGSLLTARLVGGSAYVLNSKVSCPYLPPSTPGCSRVIRRPALLSGHNCITSAFSSAPPSTPALLCNPEGTELYLFFTKLEIKRLVWKELTTGLQKGLNNNPSLFCLEIRNSAVTPLHEGTHAFLIILLLNQPLLRLSPIGKEPTYGRKDMDQSLPL